MRRECSSLDEARRRFNEYARLEPRLRQLWDLCRCAGPPSQEQSDLDDAFAADPLERDVFVVDEAGDRWCAEDYFLQQVKPRLLRLVGTHRPGEPHALHSREAYDEVYDLLIHWALDQHTSAYH